MADLAELGIKVKFSDPQNSERKLKGIEQQARKTKKATDSLSKTQASDTRVSKSYRQVQKIAQSYEAADAKAQAYWRGVRKQADKVEKDLKHLGRQNLKTFDSEQLRVFKKDLGQSETALRKLRGKIPDEEFQRLYREISNNRRALSRLNRTSRTFGRTVSNIRKKIFNMRNAMIGIAGATALGYLTKRTIDAADSIAKTADSIDLSTDTLQQYRYIAERSGVATSKLDQIFKKFSSRLSDLETGSGPLINRLEGVNDETLEMIKNADSTSQALDIVFRQMKKYEGQTDQVRIATAAFGREQAATATNMVKNIDSLRDRYERLGIEIDENLLRQAESAKDRIDDLGAVIRSSFMRVVLELAPKLGQAANNMALWVSNNEDLIEQEIPKHLGNIASAIVGVGKALSWVSGFSADFGKQLAKDIYGSADVEERIENKIQDLQRKAQTVRQNIVNVPDSRKRDRWDKELRQYHERINRLNETLKSIRRTQKDVEKVHDLDPVTVRAEPIVSKDSNMDSAIEDIVNKKFPVMGISEKVRGSISVAKEYQKQWGSANKEIKRDTEETFNYMEEFSRMTARNMQSNFSNFFYDSMTGQLDDLEDYFKRFKQTVLRILSDIMAKQLAAKAFGQSFMQGETSTIGGAVGALLNLHEGGIVGKEGKRSMASAALFANAPRLHNGFSPDEYPAVLQRGEGVFTQEQMKAMGNNPPPVEFTFIDKSPGEKEVQRNEPKWNGEKWVMSVVLNAANQNKSNFAKGMNGALGKFR